MRHHAEDVGIAVLAEQFARALVVLCGVAVVDSGHDFPRVFPFCCSARSVKTISAGRLQSNTSESNCRRNTVRPWDCRYSPEWGLKQRANRRRGVFRVTEWIVVVRLGAPR